MRFTAGLRTIAALAIGGCLAAVAELTPLAAIAQTATPDPAAIADRPQTSPYRISGPHVHDNLAVYFVHGDSAPGPVPLTLQEAIAKAAVRVIETGSVNQLEIENTGAQEVFVQAGDIVKGGKQDRVLTVSLLLAPNSGKVGIAAFCVEQGRWAARGVEDVKRFASSATALPSREAKLAMALPAKPATNGGVIPSTSAVEPRALRTILSGAGPAQGAQGADGDQVAAAADTSTRQRQVWDKVKKTQDKLSGTLGGDVAAAQSASSLQLSLENERLRQAQLGYVAALQPTAERETDVVGYVVAVNGKLASADVYPSNGLFRKMWGKQLQASVTEAIGEKRPSAVPRGDTSAQGSPTSASDPAAVAPAPSLETVTTFLAQAEQGAASQRTIAGRMKIETRDADQALLVEAARPNGAFVHRNYLAK